MQTRECFVSDIYFIECKHRPKCEDSFVVEIYASSKDYLEHLHDCSSMYVRMCVCDFFLVRPWQEYMQLVTHSLYLISAIANRDKFMTYTRMASSHYKYIVVYKLNSHINTNPSFLMSASSFYSSNAQQCYRLGYNITVLQYYTLIYSTA